MSQSVWYKALDGLGDFAIDLHKCRRFVLSVFDPASAFDYGLEYYMFVEEMDGVKQARWICRREDEELIEDWGHARMEVCQSYYEEDPREVAYQFLVKHKDVFNGRLPPELEGFREYGEPDRHEIWVTSTNEQHWISMHQSPHLGQLTSPSNMKPNWDIETGDLYVDGYIYLKVRKFKGNDQIKILNAFQDAGWPERIKDPFRDPRLLAQKANDFNKTAKRNSRNGSIFRFYPGRSQIGWKYGPPKAHLPRS